MTKRIASVFFACCLLITMLPVIALAEETSTTNGEENTDEVESSGSPYEMPDFIEPPINPADDNAPTSTLEAVGVLGDAVSISVTNEDNKELDGVFPKKASEDEDNVDNTDNMSNPDNKSTDFNESPELLDQEDNRVVLNENSVLSVEPWEYHPGNMTATLAATGDAGIYANSVEVTVLAEDKDTRRNVEVSGATVTLYVGAEAKRTATTNNNGVATISLDGLSDDDLRRASISAYKVIDQGNTLKHFKNDGTVEDGHGERDALFENFPHDSNGDYIRYEFELHSETIDANGNWLGTGLPTSIESRGNNSRAEAQLFDVSGDGSNVDMVFAIDATGSMSDSINNVKNNIASFSENLVTQNLNIRFSIIEYRDISEGEETIIHTINGSHWYSDIDSIVSVLGDISASGGGDGPESTVDALGMIASDDMYWRSDAYKFAFVLTDADYKSGNNYGYSDITDVISVLINKGIATSVITSSDYANTYSDLYNGTGGVYANISSGNFRAEMESLADSVISSTVSTLDLRLSEPRLTYNISVCYLANDKTSRSDSYRSSVKNMLNEYAKDVAQATDGHVLLKNVILFSTDSLSNFYDTNNTAAMSDIHIEMRENETKFSWDWWDWNPGSGHYGFLHWDPVTVHSYSYADGFFVSDSITVSQDVADMFDNLDDANSYVGRNTFRSLHMSGIEGAGWNNSMIDDAADYATTVTHESGHYIFGFLDEYLDRNRDYWGVTFQRPRNQLFGLMDNQHTDIEMSKAAIDYSYFGTTFPASTDARHTYHSFTYGEATEDTLANMLMNGTSARYRFDLFDCPYVVKYTKAANSDRTASYWYAGLSDEDYITPNGNAGGGSGGGGGRTFSLFDANDSLPLEYFEDYTCTNQSVGYVYTSCDDASVTFSFSPHAEYEYTLCVRVQGNEGYIIIPLNDTDDLLSAELPVALGKFAEVYLVAENGGDCQYNVYYIDRSEQVATGYVYQSLDNRVVAYFSNDVENAYTFIADNTVHTNGDYISTNQATIIESSSDASITGGEIYSTTSCKPGIDYSTISWFKYDGNTWMQLSTDCTQDVNLNIGARTDLDGSGLYVLMAKAAPSEIASPITDLSFTQSESVDGIVILNFDDPNPSSRYYNVYYSDSDFDDTDTENIVMRTFDAALANNGLPLNLMERERDVYVAVEVVLENGVRSELGKIHVTAGTADSDRDGIPDWYCDEYLLWPPDGETKDIANSDDDGDGLTNLQEYNGGSDPTNPNDPVQTTNIAVSGISVTPTSLTIRPGATKTLTSDIMPFNASNKGVVWSVADSNIATISSSGLSCDITGRQNGSTIVSVVTMDGGFAATCNITVDESSNGITVTFDANGGSGTMESIMMDADMEFILPTSTFTAPSGQRFKAWRIGETEYSAGSPYTFSEDTTITAVWQNVPIYTGGGGGGSGTATYRITLPINLTGGTIKSSSKTARSRATITLTVTPDANYELDTLAVKNSSNNTQIMLTDKGSSQYTFSMPANNVTVEVSFKAKPDNSSVANDTDNQWDNANSPPQPTPWINPFTDVFEGAYYYDAILWAVENGVTNGRSPTTFEPGTACTRAHAVTFLWRAAGSPTPTSIDNPFKDVNPGAYYYNAVLWAVEQGITNGSTATTFAPNNICNRGQIVTFLYRYARPTIKTNSSPFTDIVPGSYYYDAVNWASGNGVTQGLTANTFGPGQNCNRGQIVTFLYRHFIGE